MSIPAFAAEKKLIDGYAVRKVVRTLKSEFYTRVYSRRLMGGYLKGISEYAAKKGERNPVAGITPRTKGVTTQAVDEAFKRANISKKEAQPYYHAGLKKMFKSLKDSGSKYYPPGKYRKSLAEMGYNKGGCGFFVDEEPDDEGRFIVIETLQKFPAEKKGIKPGDRIISVDGKQVKGMNFHNLADAVRGPIGSEVRITVFRNGEYITAPIKRTWLGPNPTSLRWSVKDGNIGYVKFRWLGRRMAFELMDVYDKFKKKDVKGSIWDLRNSGGPVEAGIELAALFVPKGKLFVTKVYRSDQEAYTGKGKPFFRLPLVILVNKYTSSSCAFVAVIMRNFAGAQIIGAPVEWEGDLTETHRLKDGSAYTVTIGYYRLSDGRILKNGKIIKPGVVVKQNAVPPYGKTGDVQLKKALKIIKDKIK